MSSLSACAVHLWEIAKSQTNAPNTKTTKFFRYWPQLWTSALYALLRVQQKPVKTLNLPCKHTNYATHNLNKCQRHSKIAIKVNTSANNLEQIKVIKLTAEKDQFLTQREKFELQKHCSLKTLSRNKISLRTLLNNSRNHKFVRSVKHRKSYRGFSSPLCLPSLGAAQNTWRVLSGFFSPLVPNTATALAGSSAAHKKKSRRVHSRHSPGLHFHTRMWEGSKVSKWQI